MTSAKPRRFDPHEDWSKWGFQYITANYAFSWPGEQGGLSEKRYHKEDIRIQFLPFSITSDG